MTNTNPRATVVIPNWNGAHHLPDCLDSLQAQTFSDFETIVVDNGSSDRSLELLRNDYPWVQVIENGTNLGFPAAVNAGIRSSQAEYIVLLNNDTRAEPDWLEQLIDGMKDFPEASFAACKMLLFDPPHRIDSAGDRFCWRNGSGMNIGAGQPREAHDQPAWVFGACAGAAIYRRSLFEDIGLFDEDFFLIFEDVDLDLRAVVAGHRCIYLPNAVVYHKRGASTDLTSPVITARALRNCIWVAWKNLPPALLTLWSITYSANLLFRTMRTLARRYSPGNSPIAADDGRSDHSRLPSYRKALAEALSRLLEKRRANAHHRKLGSIQIWSRLRRASTPAEPGGK